MQMFAVLLIVLFVETTMAATPVDWAATAKAELDAARAPAIVKTKKSVASFVSSSVAESTAAPTPPTEAATVLATVAPPPSMMERSGLRLTFLFEPYQPLGSAPVGAGQNINYEKLPPTVLGQVDMRWLPFSLSDFTARPVVMGGYLASGYSRQSVPLVAASGFRYDDVVLNTLRIETGLAFGMVYAQNWNFEMRTGIGRLSLIQTSRFSDVVGTADRLYFSAAVDAAYYLMPKFALVGSIAGRTPLADGSGALAFDRLTLAGGFLVQIR